MASPVRTGSQLVRRPWICPLHGRKPRTEDDSAQQGQHGLEESPKKQILPHPRPFAPSEASPATPDPAAFPALSMLAVLGLPELGPCRITPEEACFPAHYVSLHSSQLKLKSRSSTAQRCYFCFILLGRFLCPSFYRSARQHLEEMEREKTVGENTTAKALNSLKRMAKSSWHGGGRRI